ncbi:hypothetical protein JOQ06_009547 [Pogonophryne albipinna]|uniref:Uncharacterized protein n=1 Tax=Pogonophryne albipinna TaxID=1090488 RepID=A0AAD6BMG5_9TELE|nr:hypothetical protein JOQ06_009547 [Pogonophryne albipinna]
MEIVTLDSITPYRHLTLRVTLSFQYERRTKTGPGRTLSGTQVCPGSFESSVGFYLALYWRPGGTAGSVSV